MSTLNRIKPELYPRVPDSPNNNGTRKIWGEKLRVWFIPKKVGLNLSGVTSASNASPTPSSPKDAKPKTTHGIAKSEV